MSHLKTVNGNQEDSVISHRLYTTRQVAHIVYLLIDQEVQETGGGDISGVLHSNVQMARDIAHKSSSTNLTL